MLTWGHVLVSAGGCVAAISYLLTCVCFRLLARVSWRYFLITLGCCRADISQVASGAMASANSYSKRVWFRNVSTAGPLVASLPSIPSKPRYFEDGRVALYGMLECLWADGVLRLVCLASVRSYSRWPDSRRAAGS